MSNTIGIREEALIQVKKMIKHPWSRPNPQKSLQKEC